LIGLLLLSFYTVCLVAVYRQLNTVMVFTVFTVRFSNVCVTKTGKSGEVHYLLNNREYFRAVYRKHVADSYRCKL